MLERLTKRYACTCKKGGGIVYKLENKNNNNHARREQTTNHLNFLREASEYGRGGFPEPQLNKEVSSLLLQY